MKNQDPLLERIIDRLCDFAEDHPNLPNILLAIGLIASIVMPIVRKALGGMP